jgi:hypothetical protein
MKTYQTPTLAAKGDVVTMTQGLIWGRIDPDEVSDPKSVGSVGFFL